jgi:hypothetical protein
MTGLHTDDMNSNSANRDRSDPETSPRNLPPEAQRALAEAEERRRNTRAKQRPVEVGGRRGADPVRYGDWEKAGIASDF